MTAPAILTLRARRALGAALRRIASDILDAADRCYQAVPQAVHGLGGNPARGAHRPGLADLRYRFGSIPRSRDLMVYAGASDPLRIVRIAHASRDLPQGLGDLLR